MEIATLNLTLGDAQRPLRYRKGTTDEGVIVRVLKHSGFNFGSLRRAKQLSDLYGRMVETGKTPLIVDVEAGIGASALSPWNRTAIVSSCCAPTRPACRWNACMPPSRHRARRAPPMA
jgi:hypothetical protein